MSRAVSRPVALAIGMSLIILGVLGWAIGGAVDQSLHLALHVGGDPAMLRWVLRLTNLGGAAVMIPVALLGFGWLLARRRAAPALWLFIVIASGRIIVEIAKIAIARPRPPTADRLADVTSLSFPSSHAAGAMMTGLALCLVFDARRPIWWAAILFAAAIGISRVALGVHWPSDVLAGWGFGVAWPMACARWLPRDRAAES
jgi:uncharacterized protein (TIGR03382 family)